MFYSTEVLTSRKYGVATVWLVATLGSKSTLKKISRKAILDVDVSKACETIVEPDAPMALRLQSNLLYGVTRVYSQQCGYVLADAENARNNMRAMFKVVQQAALEPEGTNKARADQLMLQDDPNFLPDLDLLPDIDNLNFDDPTILRETQLSLSPNSSQQRASSQYSIGDLMLPPSNSSFSGEPVGGLDLFGIRSESARAKEKAPAQLLEDDLGLMVDDDGNMRMDDRPASARQPHAPSDRVDATGLPGSRAHSDRPGEQTVGLLDDDGFMPLQDDGDFGVGYGSAIQHDGMPLDGVPQTTSETASAEAQRRKPRAKKVLPEDRNTSLRNQVLAEWNRNYVRNMQEAMQQKESLRMAAIAKKNAEHWMLNAGTVLGMGLRGPLDIFSGARLLERFTGVNPLERGQKRRRDDADSAEGGRRVRARAEPSSDEIARGLDGGAFQYDDDVAPVMNDDTIEQGREAPTPLDDHRLSSIFPWNQSAGSRQPTDGGHPTSASFGGPLNLFGRRGSRLTSASPLVGRDPFAGQPAEEIQFPDSDFAMGGFTGEEDFELYGPAAQVDTQTAAQSQWQRAALGAESSNFMDFVRAAIEDANLDAETDGNGGVAHSIRFDELLPPESNSNVVAAQAMLHVLTLGTKSLLKVQQQESFGPMTLVI